MSDGVCTCTPEQFCECPSCAAQLAEMSRISDAISRLLTWVAEDYGDGMVGSVVEDLMAGARYSQLPFDEIINAISLHWSK